MKPVINTLILLSLFLLSSCQKQEVYKSKAEEIFPPVPMRNVALYRMDNSPISPAFFQGQWSVVIFGTESCNAGCLKRLALVNEVRQAQKLFVLAGIASHSMLTDLAKQFSNVAISMGTTPYSFDNFYAQFDSDMDMFDDKHKQIYLINSSAELAYKIDFTRLNPGDIDNEITLLGLPPMSSR